MKNRDKILLGIIGAAAAGVAIGLLFYTDEGKKTRKKMKNKADEFADSLGSLIASGKENLSDFSHKAAQKAKEGYGKLRHKVKREYDAQSQDLDNAGEAFTN